MKNGTHCDLAILNPASSSLSEVQQVLNRAGHRAWLAGGCVRDALLGREPSDFDLVTDASVDEMKGLFPKTVLVGQEFGVLRVLHGGEEFEVAQFRKESDYQDGRHPSLVESATPEEDAQRRDLTVNALFYDPATQMIHDYVGGLADLKQRRLRSVGLARTRFLEDHLRILRAIRFRGQLDFEWDQELEKAIREESSLLRKVSRERVRDEIEKMTRASHWHHLPEFLVQSGVLGILFPQATFVASAHLALTGAVPSVVWWEWALWACRSGSSAAAVTELLISLKLSREELRSTAQFLYWFQEPWQSESLGAILERSFTAGGRAGLVQWLELHPAVFIGEVELRAGLARFPEAPEAWVRAQHLPSVQGPELGRALKEAFHRQLSGEDASLDQALARLASRSRR